MPRFQSYDGTELAYRRVGAGPLLVCVPGGPARDSAYLGTLGGLDAYRTLIILDNRGTGQSADTVDESDVDSYRADRLVADVDALRAHLGLATMDLLGHSAGAQVAVLYAAAHPDRLTSLTLLNGGHYPVGAVIEGAFEAALAQRADEPWYEQAKAALDRWLAGSTSPEVKLARAPFSYGRPFSEQAHAHAAADASQRRNPVAAANFSYEPDVTAVRARLARLNVPVLVFAGELDPSPRPEEARLLAETFPDGHLVVQPEAGHFPWVDNPALFVKSLLSIKG